METMEAILTRKSVRQFLNKEIDKETINKLLKAAMAAPSGVNKQPWHFFAVTNKETIEEIKKAMPFGKYDAPLIIIPCVKDMETVPFSHDLAYCDLSAASENILLSAHVLGLGAVWCAIYPDKKRIKDIRKILKLGPLTSPFSAIYIGYIDEEKDKGKIKDKFKNSNITFIE